MLFDSPTAARIESGEITVAIRRWKRPTVRSGGTLKSPAGLLAIDEVERIDESDITAGDVRAAGFDSRDALLASLRDGADRAVYRVRFHRAGDDPRLALRAADDLDDTARSELAARLARWDRASRTGPWTREYLEAIDRRPATVSTELADEVGVDRPTFKRRVRRLKELGLTESLERGYRLSARGEAYLRSRSDR